MVVYSELGSISSMVQEGELKASVARMDGVDVLRGLSILAVVLLHIWIRFRGVDIALGKDWSRYGQRLFRNGGNGVTVFFAVSGFLITLTSLRRFGSLDRLKPGVFYRIRFARIMPLLLLLLMVLSVFHLAHVDGYVIDEKHFTLSRALLAALTFHLNWLEASRDAWLPAVWTVLWSLSIEEMFYLFFPLVSVALFRGGRFGRAVWILLALALVAVGPWARVVWPQTDLQAENSYLAGMANIALGCLTALTVNELSTRSLRRSVLLGVEVCGWLGLVLIAIWPNWRVMRVLGKSGTDDTLVALVACLVMFGVALRGEHGGRWCAPLRWMGRHSYELYLAHEFVVIAGIELFVRWFGKDAPRGVLAIFVVGIVLATLPLGWALARYFSEPMNRWLRGARPA